ncbi:MAG TPA: hypothetical protein VE445_00445 [Nitrososphaeraceae archaeon]|nr:hypothetical protein [Nitrososphaeraceae archaeon]
MEHNKSYDVLALIEPVSGDTKNTTPRKCRWLQEFSLDNKEKKISRQR